MTVPVVTFFNNKGGVGKTSLVYHLAWMYTELGLRVVVADLDPQANLTAAFLDEDQLEAFWDGPAEAGTIFGIIRPLVRGTGDIEPARVEPIAEGLDLVVGDLSLSSFEDELSQQWPKCADGEERAFRVISAFWRILQAAVERSEADVVLVDLGPNLGAINRAALIAADHIVVPLSPDLFSLQGLKNLGPTLRRWRGQWRDRLEKNPAADLVLPAGEMRPQGYVVLQHSVRLDRPVKAYERWIEKIPQEYRESVLGQQVGRKRIRIERDPHCLAMLKHYRSLMPMAQEARKPMFFLKPAEGAIGSHARAVQSAYADFKVLAGRIADKTGIPLS